MCCGNSNFRDIPALNLDSNTAAVIAFNSLRGLVCNKCKVETTCISQKKHPVTCYLTGNMKQGATTVFVHCEFISHKCMVIIINDLMRW